MRLLVLCVVLCTSFTASALNPTRRPTQYSLRAFRDADGLPQNNVFAITQSPDGYLWVATDEGIARFDGEHFEVYDRNRVPELGSNRIRSLAVDSQGALWVGTQTGGLARLKDGRWTAFDGTTRRVRALHASSRGNVFVADEKQLMVVRGDRLEPLADLPNATALYEDADGLLWVGTHKGVLSYRGKQRVSELHKGTGLAGEDVSALVPGPDGALWFTTRDGGLHRLHQGAVTAFGPSEGLADSDLRTLLWDRDGSLWIASHTSGLYRYREGRFERLGFEHGIGNGGLISLCEDREGSIWFGSNTYGLYQLREPKFVVLGEPEGLKNPMVWSILRQRDGTLWVGTAQGLYRMGEGQLRFYGRQEGLTEPEVMSLLEDSRGRIWAGGPGGLRRLVGERFERVFPSDIRTLASTLYEDPNGVLWTGAYNALMEVHEDRAIRHAFTTSEAKVEARIVKPDPKGRGLWVGTSDGLYLFSEGRFRRFGVPDGLGSDFVKSMWVDGAGVVWVGTDGGLSRLEGERFVTLTRKRGLYDDNVLEILGDDDGNLWMASNRGISRIARQELDAYFSGAQQTVTSTFFRTADGLRSAECNSRTDHAAVKMPDGTLWFSTLDGVAWIDPRAMLTNPVAPPVVIEEVSVNRQTLSLAEASTLPAGSRDVVIRYSALSFVDPAKVQFKYRLEGFDDAWVSAGSRREAFYTNLPPGKYRFRVLAANNDGVWNEVGDALSFELLPFVYQTLWFRTLAVLVLIAAVAAGVSARLRYLKRREQELMRHNESLAKALAASEEANRLKGEFVANVSHELRTPLNSILNVPQGLLEYFPKVPQATCSACHSRFELEPGESVEASTPCPSCGHVGGLVREQVVRFEGEAGLVARHLEMLLKSGKHLLHVINDVLDFSKLEAGRMVLQRSAVPVGALLHELRETLNPIAEQKQIRIEVPDVPPELLLDADPVKVMQVFINLLGNALKFSEPGTTVGLSATVEGRACVIGVRDEGPGIAPEHQGLIFESFRQVDGGHTRKAGGTGLGLSISKHLVALHQGDIWLQSELGRGTTFFVRLPRFEAQEAPLPAAPVEARKSA